MKVFVSYHFDPERPDHEQFVHRVSYHLNRQPDVDCYCYAKKEPKSDWRDEVAPQLDDCDKFVFVLGRQIGRSQHTEAKVFLEQTENSYTSVAVIQLPEHTNLPADMLEYRPAPIDAPQTTDAAAEPCARQVYRKLNGAPVDWIADDGLPLGYPFAYEKDIIKGFIDGGGRMESPTRLEQGCLRTWPDVTPSQGGEENPIPEEEIGKYRPFSARIIVDTRSMYHSLADTELQAQAADDENGPPPDQQEQEQRTCLTQLGLVIPEAGPRKWLKYNPGNALTVGIVVSGGIAPGINSVIAGIVDRHELYRDQYLRQHGGNRNTLRICGYRDGFEALWPTRSTDLTGADVRDAADQGGSALGTSRCDRLLPVGDACAQRKRSVLLDDIVTNLHAAHVDILYIIGGDGTMRAAHALWTRAKAKLGERAFSVIAIPKTMDNDILWVWQSFGFLSAVEKAREFAMQLHTEASSNPRLCVMQLFGSDSGFVVGHTALASRKCDLALIPESPLTMQQISTHICKRLRDNFPRPRAPDKSPYGMVIMAETAIPKDVEDYIENEDVGLAPAETQAVRDFIGNGRRVQGQTPDALRSAGLKIVSRVLEREIRGLRNYWGDGQDFRVFTNEPRHLLRAIHPSAQDVIFAQRLGILAVDNAMAGYTDVMVSQWLTEFVLVPLPLVVLGRKRVPPTGIFWKSVLANTGQPPGDQA